MYIYIFKYSGRKEKKKVNYRLIAPCVATNKYLPQSWRDMIDYSEDASIMAHHQDVDNLKRELPEEEVGALLFLL